MNIYMFVSHNQGVRATRKGCYDRGASTHHQAVGCYVNCASTPLPRIQHCPCAVALAPQEAGCYDRGGEH